MKRVGQSWADRISAVGPFFGIMVLYGSVYGFRAAVWQTLAIVGALVVTALIVKCVERVWRLFDHRGE